MNEAAYFRIANLLRDRINSGEFPPGSRLPSIRTLRMAYHVAAGTVIKALDELRNEGLIEAMPGSGYYVVDRKTQNEIDELRSRIETLEQRMDNYEENH